MDQHRAKIRALRASTICGPIVVREAAVAEQVEPIPAEDEDSRRSPCSTAATRYCVSYVAWPVTRAMVRTLGAAGALGWS